MATILKSICVAIGAIAGVLTHKYTSAIDICNEVIAHSNSAAEKKTGKENIIKFTKRRRWVLLISLGLIILIMIISSYVA